MVIVIKVLRNYCNVKASDCGYVDDSYFAAAGNILYFLFLSTAQHHVYWTISFILKLTTRIFNVLSLKSFATNHCILIVYYNCRRCVWQMENRTCSLYRLIYDFEMSFAEITLKYKINVQFTSIPLHFSKWFRCTNLSCESVLPRKS